MGSTLGPCPIVFGALFLGSSIFGQNGKEGDEGLAKLFRALLKVLYCWITLKEFSIWAKCPRRVGGLGVTKVLKLFF